MRGGATFSLVSGAENEWDTLFVYVTTLWHNNSMFKAVYVGMFCVCLSLKSCMENLKTYRDFIGNLVRELWSKPFLSKLQALKIYTLKF